MTIPRFRIFGRRCGKSAAQPDSAEDWRPGDVAECVYAGGWISTRGYVPPDVPRMGERYAVVAVNRAPEQYLRFRRFGAAFWNAAYFRKIKPQADELIAADPAFLGLELRPRERVDCGRPTAPQHEARR